MFQQAENISTDACTSCIGLNREKLLEGDPPSILDSENWPNPTVKKLVKTAEGGCLPCSIIRAAVFEFGLVEEVKQYRAEKLQEWRDSGNPLTPLVEKVTEKVHSYGIPTEPETFDVPSEKDVGYEDHFNGLSAIVRLYQSTAAALYLPQLKLDFDDLHTQCVYLYTLIDQNPPLLPLIPVSEQFEQFDSADGCMRLVQSWIQQSNKDFSQPPRLPTRVLDVRNNIIRLIESSTILGRYVTLSHSWGTDENDRPFRTTLSNFSEVCIGIPWSALSKTFQDAVQTTRSLGLDYIWIDSMCIIQDDPKDWEQEAGKMADVYSNSYLSIMNPQATKPSSGLFTDRYLNGKNKPLKISRTCEGVSYDFFARRSIEHVSPNTEYSPIEELPDEPLFSRAWVFQELYLAPRILFFGRHELQFISMGGTACECTAFSSYRTKDRTQMMDRQSFREALTPNETSQLVAHRGYNMWCSVIESYAYRNLTFESDRLPALSGMAKRWKGTSSDVYLAGLWESSLVSDLCWYPVAPTPKLDEVRLFQSTTVRLQRYQAPSWSWASVMGRVQFWDQSASKGESSGVTTLVEAKCQTNSRDSTGSVSGGYIIVTGPVREAVLRYDLPGNMPSRCSQYWLELEGETYDHIYDDDFRPLGPPFRPQWWRGFVPDVPLCDPMSGSYIEPGGSVLCLQVEFRDSHFWGMIDGSDSVLLLGKNAIGGSYRRLGFWLLDRKGYFEEVGGNELGRNWFDGCGKQTIKIE